MINTWLFHQFAHRNPYFRWSLCFSKLIFLILFSYCGFFSRLIHFSDYFLSSPYLMYISPHHRNAIVKDNPLSVYLNVTSSLFKIKNIRQPILPLILIQSMRNHMGFIKMSPYYRNEDSTVFLIILPPCFLEKMVLLI